MESTTFRKTLTALGVVTFFSGLALLSCGLSPSVARADWEFLPESRHHLYQSYSFFIEQHNIIAWRGSSRFWAAVALTVPVAGNNDSTWQPQFLFHLSGNDAMHTNEGGGVFTETLDTRLGFSVEMALPLWELRTSLGYFHQSGHTADGSDDPSLAPLNLGDNVFRIRIMRDYQNYLRAGITFIPISHAIPDNLVSGMDEFVELFPLGNKENSHGFSPFAAFGLANGINIFSNGERTYHVQAGISSGNHFSPKHTHDMRFVVGYYSGSDPRSKYSQFLGYRSNFGYLGAMFNL